MSQYFELHPVTPHKRHMDYAIQTLQEGGVILYPTDTAYGFACALDSHAGVERIARLKRLSANHQYTIVCSNMSMLSNYANMDDWTFRILKRCLPGPFTFLLNARKEVPKKILPKRKTIGVRIPKHEVCHLLIEGLGKPLLSSTAQLPDDEIVSDPSLYKEKLHNQVDIILDAGVIPAANSTIVDLLEGSIQIVRQGIGDIDLLGIE